MRQWREAVGAFLSSTSTKRRVRKGHLQEPGAFFCVKVAEMAERDDATSPAPAPAPASVETPSDTPAIPTPAEDSLDHPVLPNPVPQPENYHVAIWDEPATFACLRCALRGVTLEEMTYHLDTVHGEAPVPTPLASRYVNPATAPQTGEEALAMVGVGLPTSEEEPPPVSDDSTSSPVPEQEASV